MIKKKGKKVVRYSGIILKEGNATPGPKLSFLGKQIGNFCKEFNNKFEKGNKEKEVNVKIKVFSDGTYSFSVFTPPSTNLLRGIEKKPNKEEKKKIQSRKTISQQEIEEIAKIKLKDLNTDDL